mmetsp:Transcript_72275/g.182846  ORF Transcript_72275/g.182846 Transcript_72275/m.182846 type:complete len:248 (-) Transcript_72275:161-904(-)
MTSNSMGSGFFLSSSGLAWIWAKLSMVMSSYLAKITTGSLSLRKASTNSFRRFMLHTTTRILSPTCSSYIRSASSSSGLGRTTIARNLSSSCFHPARFLSLEFGAAATPLASSEAAASKAPSTTRRPTTTSPTPLGSRIVVASALSSTTLFNAASTASFQTSFVLSGAKMLKLEDRSEGCSSSAGATSSSSSSTAAAMSMSTALQPTTAAAALSRHRAERHRADEPPNALGAWPGNCQARCPMLPSR